MSMSKVLFVPLDAFGAGSTKPEARVEGRPLILQGDFDSSSVSRANVSLGPSFSTPRRSATLFMSITGRRSASEHSVEARPIHGIALCSSGRVSTPCSRISTNDWQMYWDPDAKREVIAYGFVFGVFAHQGLYEVDVGTHPPRTAIPETQNARDNRREVRVKLACYPILEFVFIRHHGELRIAHGSHSVLAFPIPVPYLGLRVVKTSQGVRRTP